MLRYADGRSPFVMMPTACSSNPSNSCCHSNRVNVPLNCRPTRDATVPVSATSCADAVVPRVQPTFVEVGQSAVLNETTPPPCSSSELKGVTGLVRQMIIKFSQPTVTGLFYLLLHQGAARGQGVEDYWAHAWGTASCTNLCTALRLAILMIKAFIKCLLFLI